MARSFVMGRCLGRGGFGEVYAATMTEEDGPRVPVAVKLLHESLGDNHQAVRRMQDEARLLRELSHPNILVVHVLTRLAGRTALVTELIDGADLSTCIAQETVPVRALVEVLGAIAAALHAAYTADAPGGGPLRLVHRDVKPSNLRIGRDGRVVLLDFGVARSDEITRAAVTATDRVVGSPPYLGPERFEEGPPDPSSDIYSLGATAYEALTGQRLMTLPLQVQAAHSYEPELWEPYVASRLAVGRRLTEHPELSALIADTLAYETEHRPTAAEVVARCAALAGSLPGPDLAAWVARRTWALPRSVSGQLAGMVLEEDQLQFRETEPRPAPPVWMRASDTAVLEAPTTPSQAPASPEPIGRPAPHRRSEGRGIAVLLLGVGGLGSLALLAGLLVVLAAWRQARAPAKALLTPSVDRRSAVAEVETSPPAMRPGPTASPPPKPVATVPEPHVVNRSPVREAGEPVRVAAVPASPGPVRARLRTVGDPTEVWVTPPDVPEPRIDLRTTWTELVPGTYTVWSKFDGSSSMRSLPKLVVRPDYEYTIRCNANMETCSLQ